MTERTCLRRLVVATVVVIASASAARADIFQWENINPNNPAEGKRQSTTLAPDGAGVDAVPGADLSSRNLTMAYLIGADLSPSPYFLFPLLTNLAGTNLSRADLTNANFEGAALTDADFTDAEVKSARFDRGTIQCGLVCLPGLDGYHFGTGIGLAQLYSTANYQAHDLSGISFFNNDLTGGNFVGLNLTNSDFNEADLTGADFREAKLTTASFTAATLSNSDFRDANLANANFSRAYLTGANLTGADMTGAEVREAHFYSTSGFAATQLYSTASYQAHDLTGIGLSGNDISRWNFAGQNLRGANFSGATLTGADLTGAYVHGWYASDPRNSAAGAIFGATTSIGFTAAQLYSTASYQAHDLSVINLSGNDLSGWNFAGQNLAGAYFFGANLSQANLTGAFFRGPWPLGDADLTGAEVRGAAFPGGWDGIGGRFFGGILQSQLYSTASYQAHDLTGIGLQSNNLSGWSFRGQNLTNAGFRAATLTDTDFTGARVRSANFDRLDRSSGLGYPAGTGITLAQLYSTTSYQAKDLSGIGLSYNNLAGGNFGRQNLANANFIAATLTGADLSEADLTNATFFGAKLTNADFTGAVVRGATFAIRDYYGSIPGPGGTGITLEQLYSTASYQAHDLSEISLIDHNLAGGNFVGQNLTNAYFLDATLGGADFTAADARGAYYVNAADAITTDLIWPDGHIHGLDLDAGGLLVVRDYDGNPNSFPLTDPIPITVDQHLAMGPGGTLRTVFQADAWDSTISFAPGIPVSLGGTLELTFADGANLRSQVGRTFDLFDWAGINPTGAFAVSSHYAWDLSNLYTAGQVTLTAVPEPSSIALAAMSAFGLALNYRKKSS